MGFAMRSIFPIAAAAALAALLMWTLGGTPAGGSGGVPGTVTVSSTEISGQSGKLLIVFVDSPGGAAGRLCVPITSDPFVLPPTVLTEIPGDENPCGDPTDTVVFPAGDYTLTAGIYVGGSETPEAQAQVPIAVNGNVGLQLDIAALSALPFGDMNCDGIVDGLDALAILRFTGDLPMDQITGCPEIGV